MNANSRDAIRSRRATSLITHADDKPASLVGVPAMDDVEAPIEHCHWLLDAVTAKEFGQHLQLLHGPGAAPVEHAMSLSRDAPRWKRLSSAPNVIAAHDPAAMPPHPRAERTHPRARAADRRGP